MSRIGLCALALLAALGGGVVVSVADSESVSAADGVEATEKCEIPLERPTVNVVMLLDASRSLETTDPQNVRKEGLEAAIVNLATLARSNPAVDISVAVDVFAAGYGELHGWSEARAMQQALVGRYGEITALGRGNIGRSTDYRVAMSGVAGRLQAAPPSSCNLLLWFTDGEHATEGTSSDLSQREWQQLRDLCSSEDMAYLSSRNLYTVAVLLSSPDAPVNAAPLRHLFGERAEGCEHELNGKVRDDVNIDELSDVLDELVNEVVYEVSAESESDGDLPNEDRGLPDEDDYRKCGSGSGTLESPCVFSFPLDSEHESFRVFVDMTFLGREIANPQAVNLRVQSPSGERSDLVAAPSIRSDTEDSTTYQPIRPFWLLSRRPYDSRWEIVGHQAAEQLADEEDWEWEGEWSLLFWGDTDEAAADARKVAAAVRTVTVDAASADQMSLNDQGTLIGFVENYPSDDYSSVELNLELRDSTEQPLYPTRRYLQCKAVDACNLVPVKDDGHRFEVPRLFEEIAWWDGIEAGGNGEALAKAAERGTVSLVAVLEQEFRYGGADGYGVRGERGVPLRWVNDIGSIGLDGLLDYLSGEQQWQELQDWLQSGEPPALPFGIDLGSPPLEIDGDAVTFAVTVEPGYLPGVITIDGVSVRRDGLAAPVAGHDLDWSCEVAGTRGRAATDPTDCAAIRIDLGVSEDSEVIVELDFSIGPDSGLEDFVFPESMTVPSPQERAELWEEIQRAAQPRSESVDSEPFGVDIVTSGDKLSKFLPILIALIALAALMRLLVAWRLRPWHRLDTAEFVTKRLDLGQTGGQPYGDDAIEVDSCMALTGREVKGTLGYVTIKSAWMPLLAGRGPSLEATSTRGGCIGPEGYRGPDDGQIGLIGHSLHEGWVVEVVDGQHNLVVWDLGDEPERSTSIAEVEDAARAKVLQTRSRAKVGGRETKSSTDGSAGDRGPDDEHRPPSRSRDPFEDYSDPSDDTQPPPEPLGGPRDDPFG